MPRIEKNLFLRTVTAAIFLLLISELPFVYSKTNIPGPASEVKILMGRPTFFIENKPCTAPLFRLPIPNTQTNVKRYCRQMAEIGIHVYSFEVACGEGMVKTIWMAPDQWDFSEMDQISGEIISADPNAILMLNIAIVAPKWWREQNPDEMMVLSDGQKVFTDPMYPVVVAPNRTFESISSGKWRKDMSYSMRKLIDHVQNSAWGKRVFAYQVFGLRTCEWYHWSVNQTQLGDYNPQMKAAFIKWLKEKYKSEHNLRLSWSNPNITFEKVEIPTEQERKIQNRTFRDPTKQMNVIDWYIFYNDIVAETIDYFAGVVKDATGGKKIVGTFYDYLFEFRGNPEFGHNSGRKLLLGKNIDFICAPPSYFERQLGSGMEGYRRPFLSGTLHGKLWFHDNDNTSYLYEKAMEQYAKDNYQDYLGVTEQLRPTTTAQGSIWMFERSAGFTIAEGIYENYFDLTGGYYDHPKLLYAMKQIKDTLDRSKNYDRSSIAQILVVADETSLAYGTWQKDDPNNPYSNRINHSLVAHQIGFIKSGTPYDTVLLEDLPLMKLDQYKFIVFLNTWHMNSQMRKFIDKKIKTGGRTIMWCYAPGLFNGNTESAKNIFELTGIRVIPAGSEQFIRPQIQLNDNGKKFMTKFGQKPIEKPISMDDTVQVIPRSGRQAAKKIDPNLNKICKLFFVEDNNAQSLGTLPDTRYVTFAKKDMQNWTSIYSLLPALPPDLIRTIAKSAGVHIYTESGDSFYANKSYLVLNAASAGNKTVKMSYPCDIYNALTEQKWFDGVTMFDTSLMFGETQIFRYGKTITGEK